MACFIGVLWPERMMGTPSACLSRRADFDSQKGFSLKLLSDRPTMKPAHYSPIIAQQTTRLAREGDTMVEPFSVLACLTEIQVLVRGIWEPNIHFDLHASLDLLVVTCSRAGLQSAIMNLLSNAREALPGGGVISLVVAVIYEGHIATEVEVRVTDNGFGMSKDTLLRAFDPFFTTKTTGLGGLGLPMVMRFAQESGGRLNIESERGVGTIVTLRLPIPGSGAQHQPASPSRQLMPKY
jgi:signal transduction histidine kinase